MKLLKYLLLSIPMLSLCSCSDGDDIPDVAVSADIYGYYYVPDQDKYYVLPDDQLIFSEVTVKDKEGAGAMISNINYEINGYFYYATGLIPFQCVIPTDNFVKGENVVTLDMTVGVVGYPVSMAVVDFYFTAVDSAEELPEGAIYVPAPWNDEEPSQE